MGWSYDCAVRALDVLAFAKAHRPSVLTKSSIMLGLGETDDEIANAMDDLRRANVDLLTLGQYLRPTVNHLPIERWVTPDDFARYRDCALALGMDTYDSRCDVRNPRSKTS
jgi:lipoic acid synthetase